jgi:phosphoribosylformylglycinamidine (FGAM) synthase-like enzyme
MRRPLALLVEVRFTQNKILGSKGDKEQEDFVVSREIRFRGGFTVYKNFGNNFGRAAQEGNFDFILGGLY